MSVTWSPVVQGSTIKIVVVVYRVITAMERHSAADFALLIMLAWSLLVLWAQTSGILAGICP